MSVKFDEYSKPILSKDGVTVLYGIYPQTVVWSKKLITDIKKEGIFDTKYKTYFYKNNLYIKDETPPVIKGGYECDKNYFNNGRVVKDGEEYWFKCQSIVWRVLYRKDNVLLPLSEKIIDGGVSFETTDPYYFKRYSESRIRKYINKEFFEFAFQFGNKNVLTTIVNNKEESTSSKKNNNACEDTIDKVFLLCFKDLFKNKYGFFTSYDESSFYSGYRSESIKAEITDYAVLKKGTFENDYWTRSPSEDCSLVWYVDDIDLKTINYEEIGGPLLEVLKSRRWGDIMN